MKRIHGMRVGFLLLLGIGVSACAQDGATGYSMLTPAPYPPPGYAHRVETSHVALFWNCTNSEPGVLRLEGVAVNPWAQQPVRFLEFGLSGVDARESTVSEGAGEARDIQIYTMASSPFLVELRSAGSEVRYDLYYQYQISDPSHDNLISGPMVSGAFPRHHGTPFMVRDACSPTQHLMR